MTDSLQNARRIDPNTLDGAVYLSSLLTQASEKQLITSQQLEALQSDFLCLLADTITRFNAGESSSIRVEKAHDLLDSIFFTTGLALKAFGAPEAALAALLSRPAAALYADGQKRLDAILSEIKAAHKALCAALIPSPSVFYAPTLRDGIAGFFKLYDPAYAAQEVHITFDYPLFVPMPRLTGIEFVRRYLAGAALENAFCAFYTPQQLHRILCVVAPDYAHLMLNFYEVALTAALGCVIAGTNITAPVQTAASLAKIEAAFPAGISKANALHVLQNAATGLQDAFSFTPAMAAYVSASLPLIAARIVPAAKGHSLKNVFAMPQG